MAHGGYARAISALKRDATEKRRPWVHCDEHGSWAGIFPLGQEGFEPFLKHRPGSLGFKTGGGGNCGVLPPARSASRPAAAAWGEDTMPSRAYTG
ncbi:MAG: hypothetical protein LBT14_07440 [Treponema sp.]|nr:hypothetical protein [Treponema sp.]